MKNGDIDAANIAEYDYYKNGAAKSVIYAGGAREDYTYYPDGRLESLVNKDNKGVAFESYVYTYDANGNMLSKEDKKGKTSYTYDNLNRLKKVNEEYIGKTTEYIYDKLGNRSNVTIKENGIITEEHTYNYNYDLNQLNSVIVKVDGTVASITYYTYDANGNQIKTETDGITTIFAYDEFNQLISADGAKYGYNAEGYRVSKNVNGSLTRYIYEYDKVVLEVNTAGNQEGRNIYGTNLLMRTVDGESYYYMYNGHADVTALINVATGNIDATYYYDAFGNIIESIGAAKDKNSILYSGYQYDEETGLYYLNARMYDPKIARFIQEDTYIGDPNAPLSLNLYTYCANNPLIYYDPTGHLFIRINKEDKYTTSEEIQKAREETINWWVDKWNNLKTNFGNWGKGIKESVTSTEGAKNAVIGIFTSLANNSISVIQYGSSAISGAPNETWAFWEKIKIDGNRNIEEKYVTNPNVYQTYKTFSDVADMSFGAKGFYDWAKSGFKIPNIGSIDDYVDAGTGARIKANNSDSILNTNIQKNQIQKNFLEAISDSNAVNNTNKPKIWDKYPNGGVIKFNSIDEQIEFLTDNVPGLTKEQSKKLLEFAFQRDSSVTIGGSRIRGNYTDLSDLDVGFSKLSNGQYKRLIDSINKMDGVKFENKIKLIVGNETSNIPKIESMEEFFQRSGTRLKPDSSGSHELTPSGSITLTKDGLVKIIPPGGER